MSTTLDNSTAEAAMVFSSSTQCHSQYDIVSTGDEVQGYRDNIILSKVLEHDLPGNKSAEQKLVDRILSLYPLSNFSSTRARTFYKQAVPAPVPIVATATYSALLSITGDAACGGGSACGCTTHKLSGLIAGNGSAGEQTWMWRWDYRPMQQLLTGACHCSEVIHGFPVPLSLDSCLTLQVPRLCCARMRVR